MSVELTATEQRMFDEYTRAVECGERLEARLVVEGQQFTVHDDCEDVNHAEWYRAMLAKALAKVLRAEGC